MLEKAEERHTKKGGGQKRKHPDEIGEGEEGKRKGGDGGEKGQGGGAKKHLDALSVGYFRRVGERLGEGFDEDEERGEEDYSSGAASQECYWSMWDVQKMDTLSKSTL